MKKFKKIAMLMLAAALVFACFAALSVNAAAAGRITYYIEQDNGVAYLSANPANDGNYLVYTTDGTAPKADGKVLAFFVSFRTKTLVRIAEFTPDGERVSGLKLTVAPKMPNVDITVVKNDGFTTVSCSCAVEDAEIHYTTDDTNPTEDSPLYVGIISVTEKTKMRFAAFKEGCKRSAVIIKTINVSKTPAKPAVKETVNTDTDNSADPEPDPDPAPAGAKIKSSVSYYAENGYTKVTLTPAKTSDTIYYTLDGSTPSKSNGTKYNGKYVRVTEPCTLRAVEYNKSGAKVASLTTSVKLKCAPVEFDCVDLYAGTRAIELTTKTPDADIYYTLNGSNPAGSSGRLYRGPIDVGDDTLIKTVVKKSGYVDSPVQMKKASAITFSTVDYDEDDPVAWEIVNAINAERARRGLNALAMNSQMQKAANIRVREAAIYFGNIRPNGEGYESALEEQGLSVAMRAELFILNYTNINNYLNFIKGRDDERILFGKDMRFDSMGVGVLYSGSGKFVVVMLAEIM